MAAQTPRKGKEAPSAASIRPHALIEAACAQDERPRRARTQAAMNPFERDNESDADDETTLLVAETGVIYSGEEAARPRRRKPRTCDRVAIGVAVATPSQTVPIAATQRVLGAGAHRHDGHRVAAVSVEAGTAVEIGGREQYEI